MSDESTELTPAAPSVADLASLAALAADEHAAAQTNVHRCEATYANDPTARHEKELRAAREAEYLAGLRARGARQRADAAQAAEDATFEAAMKNAIREASTQAYVASFMTCARDDLTRLAAIERERAEILRRCHGEHWAGARSLYERAGTAALALEARRRPAYDELCAKIIREQGPNARCPPPPDFMSSVHAPPMGTQVDKLIAEYVAAVPAPAPVATDALDVAPTPTRDESEAA